MINDKILVSVDGGLGDHVLAEPAIRYLTTKVFTEADVRIRCNVPRAFQHLGVPVEQHNGYDLPGFRKLLTFPTTGPLFESLCFLTTHMVDFHAAALMYRALPLLDKTIKLGVTDADRAALRTLLGEVDPKQLVLVHAGKSWPSKTFPREWWQATTDALHARGLHVCLIGKRTPENPRDATGLVEVALPPGGIDLRDKLSLGALFAVIESAQVLLSNDTSLIQIAGAFDNWIVLIPSCKHPDFVLPYRNGTPYYKAKALCKKLVIDDWPFEPVRDGGLKVDTPVSDWTPYLPEPESVAHEVEKICRTK